MFKMARYPSGKGGSAKPLCVGSIPTRASTFKGYKRNLTAGLRRHFTFCSDLLNKWGQVFDHPALTAGESTNAGTVISNSSSCIQCELWPTSAISKHRRTRIEQHIAPPKVALISETLS